MHILRAGQAGLVVFQNERLPNLRGNFQRHCKARRDPAAVRGDQLWAALSRIDRLGVKREGGGADRLRSPLTTRTHRSPSGQRYHCLETAWATSETRILAPL